MEKRIGTISIVIYNKAVATTVNSLLSEYSNSILARQGIPLFDKGLHIITLVIESTSNEINALTGKLGRLESVEVKSILAKGNNR